ncbi:MAG TPA: hypothetical protein VKV39_02950 [Candidatus Sulfotelmatobacter sp.]|nr:hypothetical protein [Candidatus Sulfotelmatobacter sp.]
MKLVSIWWLILLFAASSIAQSAGSGAPKKKATSRGSVEAELQELKQDRAVDRQQIESLQQEVAILKEEMRKRDESMNQAQASMQEVRGKADQAASQAGQEQQTVAELKNDVTDLKQNAANTALSLQETQKNLLSSVESPVAMHYRGVTITPGGFLAGETVWRSHALGADINTPFNSVPFAGADAAHLSEFFGSGRQSRVSMLAEGKLGSAKLSGYVESDFLSSGVTSNNNQSNSYSLRQRQAWGQASLKSGWSFTGGQMWSLITETKQGVENRSEALPMTIDPQYTVGFSWARQFGFRVAKNFGSTVSWALGIENSQATLGGHLASGQNNFVIGSQGSGGGLYNATANYSFNPAPDFITKVVFQPKGMGHYEVFGLLSDFRDRIYPCGGNITATNGVLPPPVPCGTGNVPNASGAYTSSKVGGGFGVNARITLASKFDLGVHAFAGDGIGRYGTAGLPDVVARPDGVLVPARNYQALGTLEYHSKRLDLYTNVGLEYEARTAYLFGGKGAGYGSPLFNNSGCYVEGPPSSTITNVNTPSSTPGSTGSGTVPVGGPVGTPISQGFNPSNPANCTGDTRSIIEGTIGFWYRLYSGSKGRLQFGPQYSYIDRNTWFGVGATPGIGSSPNASENMVLTSFRFYLP